MVEVGVAAVTERMLQRLSAGACRSSDGGMWEGIAIYLGAGNGDRVGPVGRGMPTRRRVALRKGLRAGQWC
jgi:hypothetical protein